jgi:hypothetical protein
LPDNLLNTPDVKAKIKLKDNIVLDVVGFKSIKLDIKKFTDKYIPDITHVLKLIAKIIAKMFFVFIFKILCLRNRNLILLLLGQVCYHIPFHYAFPE